MSNVLILFVFFVGVWLSVFEDDIKSLLVHRNTSPLLQSRFLTTRAPFSSFPSLI
jgi:hypothetical protein